MRAYCGSAGDPHRRDFRIDQSRTDMSARRKGARDLPQARMQPLSRAHLPLRALQLPDPNRGCGVGGGDRDVARRFVNINVGSEHEGIRMKLNELASKLGLEVRGDGGVELFAPA